MTTPAPPSPRLRLVLRLTAAAALGVGVVAAPTVPAAAQRVVAHGSASIHVDGSFAVRASVGRRRGRASAPPPVAPPTPAVARVPGRAGGPVQVQSLGAGCRGFVPTAPNHTLVVENARTWLELAVIEGPASVLLLRSPEGRLTCVERPAPGAPLLLTDEVAPGTHQVFVGRDRPGVAPAGYLLQVESRAGWGLSAPPPAPPASGWHGHHRPTPVPGTPFVDHHGDAWNHRGRRARGIPFYVLDELDRGAWVLIREGRVVDARVRFAPNGRVRNHPIAETWARQGRRFFVFGPRGGLLATFDRSRFEPDGDPVLVGRDQRGARLVLRRGPGRWEADGRGRWDRRNGPGRRPSRPATQIPGGR
jgi:hypothetical protein